MSCDECRMAEMDYWGLDFRCMVTKVRVNRNIQPLQCKICVTDDDIAEVEPKSEGEKKNKSQKKCVYCVPVECIVDLRGHSEPSGMAEQDGSLCASCCAGQKCIFVKSLKGKRVYSCLLYEEKLTDAGHKEAEAEFKEAMDEVSRINTVIEAKSKALEVHNKKLQSDADELRDENKILQQEVGLLKAKLEVAEKANGGPILELETAVRKGYIYIGLYEGVGKHLVTYRLEDGSLLERSIPSRNIEEIKAVKKEVYPE